ncbi:MAG: Rieske (2Fe-2S) iron-sulfur domain protein [Actinomycetia bacterium]|nr:Rieske (2Fe-2S) iron-sulfur domain protein [Actinomycetes bacterium]
MRRSVASVNEDADATFLKVASYYWHPVARSIDLPPGAVVPARLLGRDLALFRDAAGRANAVEDLCSHRGTRLSRGDVDGNGCLRCPYHGWAFRGDGSCVDIPQLPPERSIPAQADVTSFRVSEYAGLVWTCLVDEETQRRERPTWPVIEAGTHWVHVGVVYPWQVQASRQIENFCDVAHFSVLHADTFGNARVTEVESFHVDVSLDGHHLAFDYAYPSLDPTVDPGPGGARPEVGTNFEYRVELPFTVALAGASGPGSVMCVAASPVSATEMNLFWLCAFPLGVEVDAEAYEDLEARIFLPDQEIVESQRPERLPLDLLEELHLPFDRFAVAYRRQLQAIGFAIPGRTFTNVHAD